MPTCKTTIAVSARARMVREIGKPPREKGKKERGTGPVFKRGGEGAGIVVGRKVAVGAIRCLEPRVVANHLLGVKNSKLRVDMGLCLHRLQPTTGLR